MNKKLSHKFPKTILDFHFIDKLIWSGKSNYEIYSIISKNEWQSKVKIINNQYYCEYCMGFITPNICINCGLPLEFQNG